MVRACVHPFFSLLLPAHISLSLSRFNSWTRQKLATLLPNWLFANISNQMSSVQGQTTTKEGTRLVEDRAKKTPEKTPLSHSMAQDVMQTFLQNQVFLHLFVSVFELKRNSENRVFFSLHRHSLLLNHLRDA